MKRGDLLKKYLKQAENKRKLAEESQDYREHRLSNQLFLDTSAKEIEDDGVHLLTTRAILLEIGNALLNSIERDEYVEIIPISESLYKKGFDLFRRRRDKEWGITDCISFVVMKERGLDEALTTDHHFIQAGLRCCCVKRAPSKPAPSCRPWIGSTIAENKYSLRPFWFP